MSFLPLDGPAEEIELSVSTTPVVARVNASNLDERKVVTLQAQDGKIRWGFTSGITSAKGFVAYKDQIITIEAAEMQDVYVVAVSGTVKVYVAERG